MDDILFAIDEGAAMVYQNSGTIANHSFSFRVDKTMIPASFPSLASGYVASSCGLLVGYPLDTLKVLMQTRQQMTPTSLARGVGVSTTTQRSRAIASASLGMNPLKQPQQQQSMQQTRAKTVIITASSSGDSTWGRLLNNRSFKSSYAGIEGQLLTLGTIHGITFFIYESARRKLYYNTTNSNAQHHNKQSYIHNDPLSNIVTAAFAAGSIISLITSPLMIVKTKQQLHPTWSIRDALRDSVATGGGAAFRNLYIGFIPHFYCETIGRVFYFGTYEFMKRSLQNYNDTDIFDSTAARATLSLPQRMFCAQISGMICWTVIYPMDVLRCRMYALHTNASNNGKQTSALQLAKQMWSTEGRIKPFARGFSLTIARAGPVAAIVLPVYDATLELLNKQIMNEY